MALIVIEAEARYHCECGWTKRVTEGWTKRVTEAARHALVAADHTCQGRFIFGSSRITVRDHYSVRLLRTMVQVETEWRNWLDDDGWDGGWN